MKTYAALLLLSSSVAFAQWADPSTDERNKEGMTESPVTKEVTIVENLGETLPLELKFTDQSGKSVLLGDYFKSGRPVVVTPVYYSCPTLCSTVLQGIVASLKSTGLKLGTDYDLVTYSIDPTETPAQAYEKKLKLVHELGYLSTNTDWNFLVGDEENVKALSAALGFKYKYDSEIKQYAHAAAFMVASPTGKITRYVYGVRYPSADLKLTILEAAEGKVGIWERFILTCYRFDPASRRYEFVVKGVIKGGALIVFFALASFLFVLWRRELRRNTAAPTKA